MLTLSVLGWGGVGGDLGTVRFTLWSTVRLQAQPNLGIAGTWTWSWNPRRGTPFLPLYADRGRCRRAVWKRMLWRATWRKSSGHRDGWVAGESQAICPTLACGTWGRASRRGGRCRHAQRPRTAGLQEATLQELRAIQAILKHSQMNFA